MVMTAALTLYVSLSVCAAPVDVSAEAVCNLQSLFNTEASYLGDHDRYSDSPKSVGFLPLPCTDGTRAATTGDSSVGGCRFIFNITRAARTREDANRATGLELEAVGVGPEADGLRFVVRGDGQIRRADGAAVTTPDCDAWGKVADPLWWFRSVDGDHDCFVGRHAANHPCTAALAKVKALADAGDRLAQQAYESRILVIVPRVPEQKQTPPVLLAVLEGKWEGLTELAKLPQNAETLELLERAHRQHPGLSPRLDLLFELWGRGAASDSVFATWTDSAPCRELEDSTKLTLGPNRLILIAQTDARCPGTAVTILSGYTAGLAPRELKRVLQPISAEHLGWIGDSLGLENSARAAELLEWIVDRQPRILEKLPISLPIFRGLLSDRMVNRIGGRAVVLDLLLGRKCCWNGEKDEDVWPELYREALKDKPSPELVRNVSERLMPGAEKHRIFASSWHSPDRRIQAALAAGFADTDVGGIPRDAASACLSELRVSMRCVEKASASLGKPPLGPRFIQMSFCGVGEKPTPPRPPEPIEVYCGRLASEVQKCPNACGGSLPDAEIVDRLAKAAGEPFAFPQSLRACEYQRLTPRQ